MVPPPITVTEHGAVEDPSAVILMGYLNYGFHVKVSVAPVSEPLTIQVRAWLGDDQLTVQRTLHCAILNWDSFALRRLPTIGRTILTSSVRLKPAPESIDLATGGGE